MFKPLGRCFRYSRQGCWYQGRSVSFGGGGVGTRKRTEFSRQMFWSFEEQEEFPLAHLLTSALPGARGQSGQTEVQTRRFCVGPSPRSAAHPSEPRLPQLRNGGDSHCLAGQREPGGAACSALARSPRERQAPPPPTVHVGKAVHHRKGEPCPGPARGRVGAGLAEGRAPAAPPPGAGGRPGPSGAHRGLA